MECFDWKNYFGKYIQTWEHNNCTKAIDKENMYKSNLRFFNIFPLITRK